MSFNPQQISSLEEPAMEEKAPREGSIVYLDKDFAVVVKEAGELCGEGTPRSLSGRLRPLIEEKLGHKVSRCECVHRLDRPVSGLCLLGLTAQAVSRLSRCFSGKSVGKTYCAITERTRLSATGGASPVAVRRDAWCRLDCFMTFDRRSQKARIVNVPAEEIAGGAKSAGKPGGAKRASLQYKVLGQGERYDFLLVEPLTGRSHQIRCQLAAEGRPIKGDLKYGAKRSEKGGGIRLHAWKLEFCHPVTGEELGFTCLPPKMDGLWRACTELLH